MDNSRGEMTSDEAERDHAQSGESRLLQVATYVVMALLLLLAGYLLYQLFLGKHPRSGGQILLQTLHDSRFWAAFAVGLVAAVIDGALGMAYGVTASSFLLAMGATPLIASGATHLAEVFTIGTIGVSHLRLGNVSRKLFLSLVLPGVAGGLIGAYVLRSIHGSVLKPWISGYLLLMGLYVLSKAFRRILLVRTDVKPATVTPLALFGGFVDASGGGGWGAIVTTSLVGTGHDPRITVGSVNLAKFFLSVGVASAFFSILDASVWLFVGGLVVGGMFAAPFAAYITRHFKARVLLVMVGTLIIAISTYNLYHTLTH